ncbi:MAG TPA: thermonuclease family protein [Pseudorhodoplanes sp.]|nr:thermonuclease family protein [Pseudorhodoplanes sp.]
MPPHSRHLIGTMGRWRCRVVVALAGFYFGADFAAPAQTQPACPLHPLGEGTVAQIIDGRSLRLADGREIRLAGIEVPLPARPGENPEPAASAARAELESLLAQRVVTLKASASETDRYGRIAAYVFTAGSEVPLQHALLARGHARAFGQNEPPACRRELLAREEPARNAGIGLWADPAYAIRRAEEPERIATQRGHFAVIEGKVLSVRTSGATIYLNFGRRWIEGFAVTIRKRNERAFAAAGLAPGSLEGQLVRVRGFVEQRGGPRIEAASPEQFEIVGGNQTWGQNK